MSSGVTPPSKAAKGSSSSSSSRVVVVPAGERKDDPLERSRRLLEAAGCYGVTEGKQTVTVTLAFVRRVLKSGSQYDVRPWISAYNFIEETKAIAYLMLVLASYCE